MAYTLALEGVEALIDIEFDRLYAHMVEGEWMHVRERCEELLCNSESAAWVHLLLGYTELHTHNFDAAYHHFQLGCSSPEPLRSESIAGMGRALLGSSRGSEALELLQDLVSRYPVCHFAWQALGETLAALGNYEQAWLCAKRATQLSPTHGASMALLVATGNSLGQHAELASCLEEIQRAQPANLDVRGARALSLLREERFAEAADEMARVIAFAPFAQVSPAVLEAIRQSISVINKGEG